MKLRLPLLLCAMVLLVALLMVMATVRHQTLRLAAQERQRVQALYVDARERELQQYVLLARAAIERMAAEAAGTAALQRQALAVLARMRFANDGYFFVYDRHGRILLDPGQMDTQGVDFCEPDDPSGAQQASLILATARQGGGMVRYDWLKPSTSRMVPKMSYVTRIQSWGWTLGAGLYLDEVEQRLQQIDREAADNITQTHQRIALIAALAVVLTGLGWLTMAWWQQRRASQNVQRLTLQLARARDGERQHLARELHDGVMQVMISSRYLIEAAQRLLTMKADDLRTQAPTAGALTPQSMLQACLQRLDDALGEIRRVSHGMPPALLEGRTLPDALTALVEQLQGQCPLALQLHLHTPPQALPPHLGVALLRITQEAVSNACRHSQASHLHITLTGEPRHVRLDIRDNGHGFAAPTDTASTGMGLRNMHERVQALGGSLDLHTGAWGTEIRVRLPCPATPQEGPA